VTVIAAPIVNITGTQTTVVNGATSANLTASVLPEGDYTYAWSTGDSDPSISVNEAGVYNVTVTDANQCTAVSMPFQVYPVSDFQITMEGSHFDCMSGNVNVEASINGDNYSSSLIVSWLANGQYIEGQHSYSFSMPAQELYDLIHVTDFDLCIEVADPNNCEHLVVNCFDKHISGDITPHHVIVMNNGTEAGRVCEGAQLDLTVMVQDQDGEVFESSDFNYIWTRNGVVIPGVHGSSFSEQAWIYDSDPVTYVYAAYIDYGNGCISDSVASTEIYVRRNPIVTIDGNPNVCYNGLTQEPNVS